MLVSEPIIQHQIYKLYHMVIMARSVESSGNGNRAGIELPGESSAGTGKGAAGIWVESETGIQLVS